MSGQERFAVRLAAVFALVLGLGLPEAKAGIQVQCPGDINQDAIVDLVDPAHPNAVCRHMAAGDGFISMADTGRRRLYMFGFSDMTGTPAADVMAVGLLGANFPAPTIAVDERDELYLTVSNVGMAIRPDLFDPHSIHWHGFPNASAIFDGQPDGAIAINQGGSLTYYYDAVEPGTYMYHCHVEATEHMQMGMLGNIYVRPAQNRLPNGTLLGTHVHSNPDWNATRRLDDPLVGDKYAYNDGDGITRYDVEVPIQIGSFDPNFHDASESIQPLPFAAMKDLVPMLNGRGYPDTINPGWLPVPADAPRESQKVSTVIEANQGQRVLLRISNLNVTRFNTLATVGLSMRVVGHNARLLRGPDPAGVDPRRGKDLSYTTSSVTVGGGESVDVILDTAGVNPGTYFLYTTNLNFLSNNDEDLGGQMSEIVIRP